MVVLLSTLALVAVIAVSAVAPDRTAPQCQPRRPVPAEEDQIDLLLRDGIDTDAGRLAEQGIDLGVLGYRPPHEG